MEVGGAVLQEGGLLCAAAEQEKDDVGDQRAVFRFAFAPCWLRGQRAPLRGLSAILGMLIEHLLGAKHSARSGVAEMHKAQLLISTVHAVSCRKPWGCRGVPEAAVTSPTRSVT